MKNVTAVVVGGGEGTRLNEGMPSPRPKVLYEVLGKPLISYSLKALKDVGINDIIVVVGYMGEEIKKVLGPSYRYTIQKEPLGTADAALSALSRIPDETLHVAVLYGADIYTNYLLKEVISLHLEKEPEVTLVTKIMEEPGKLGRIVRDESGEISAIVEEKVATDEQKKIKEVNDGCFIFKKDWLLENIKAISLSAAKEYFLTDLVEIAINQKVKVATYTIERDGDWIGVDTTEDIKSAEELLKGQER
ncbi:MAG: sugar phosphate nucleotidyltransferase [Candidatus Woykebacteria bacterium]